MTDLGLFFFAGEVVEGSPSGFVYAVLGKEPGYGAGKASGVVIGQLAEVKYGADGRPFTPVC